ncbi:N-6 DNA methylase [Methylobacterium mesophilicum]|uniref:N-6 DNA methylase n=1 Tax=Methylobacterium mesophilicum TaxID=39956 RepID=UPI002F35C4CC
MRSGRTIRPWATSTAPDRSGGGDGPTPLERALDRTGFKTGAKRDVAGLRRGYDAATAHLEPAFADRGGLSADAIYETDDGPKLIVKAVDAADAPFEALQERAWNLGLAPLLWVVTPVEVRVYDAYRGIGTDGDREPLGTYALGVDARMAELDALCGRFSLDTGAFWDSPLGKGVSRSGKVDRVLLDEIRALEAALFAVLVDQRAPAVGGSEDGLAAGGAAKREDAAAKAWVVAARARCQELVTGALFASYLFDRGIAVPLLPQELVEAADAAPGPDQRLARVFADRGRTFQLFRWLHDTFNGDVFPPSLGVDLPDEHLRLLEAFARGEHLYGRERGQGRLFRFRFDTVPVELVSSVYETFAQRAASDMSMDLGVHYTPVELVHMALDPVFEGLPAGAGVLDPTCGSGLFLVQALRRLVWMQCGDGPRPRATVRDVLYRQVHGIDVQEAALRIAAFGLYLAALELETEAGPNEPIGFRRLVGLTLHRMDFLSPAALNLARELGVDAIVGNPPWTHGAVEPPPDEDGPGEDGDEGDAVEDEIVTTASRSPDQRFLWRAIDVMGPRGRVAMYVKAAPLLSRSPKASAFRNALLRRVDRLALLNMSPLRLEGLFSDASSPGMFVCTNCGNLPARGRMLVGTFPWTPEFAQSGALALSSADVREVDKARAVASPSYLKASMVGTPRDADAMERFESDGILLSELLDGAGVLSGRGFQDKGGKRTPVPAELSRMLVLWKTGEYSPLSLDGVERQTAAERGLDALFRVRDPEIFRGPLLVVPKSAHVRALEPGRLSASLSEGDLYCSENFYSFSFAAADRRLAIVLCALLNSVVPAYQLLFGAGALGTERPSIPIQDVRALRFPQLAVTDRLAAEASEALAAARLEGGAPLDAFAVRAWRLAPHERELVSDTVRRARSTFIGSREALRGDVVQPSLEDLRGYADAACRTVDAVLRFGGRRHLRAAVILPRTRTVDPMDGFLAVRFSVEPGRPDGAAVRVTDAIEADDVYARLRGHLVRAPTPYLRERRSLRIYEGTTVTFVKPAQRRYWLVSDAMHDGDLILADHAPGTGR